MLDEGHTFDFEKTKILQFENNCTYIYIYIYI